VVPLSVSDLTLNPPPGSPAAPRDHCTVGPGPGAGAGFVDLLQPDTTAASRSIRTQTDILADILMGGI